MRPKTFGSWQDRGSWALVLTGLVLLLLPARTRFALSVPLQTVVLAPLRGLTALAQRYGRLESENQRLSRLAADLAVDNARLRTLSRPAEMPAGRHRLVRSPVIARDLTLERWLTVSRGRRHGVFPGAPVLAPAGVVGKVVAAGEHQALVQTVLEPASRLAVMNLRSRVPALCRSPRQGLLCLDYAAKGSDFVAGDTLVTAGLGQVFPRNLAVGLVETAEDLPSELFKSVRVKPFADIARLEHVFVFSLTQPPESLWTDPWLDNLAPQEIQLPAQERR